MLKEKEVNTFSLLRHYDRCGHHFEIKLMCRGSTLFKQYGRDPPVNIPKFTRFKLIRVEHDDRPPLARTGQFDKDLGSVYMGLDPFGTGMKLVRMSLVFTRGPGGSGAYRILYLVPNGSTYEGDPIWNRTVSVSNRSRVNRADLIHSGSDPKRI